MREVSMMFLLKYFKGFLVIQCTHLLCTHYKVEFYCTMHYFGHEVENVTKWLIFPNPVTIIASQQKLVRTVLVT